MPEPGRHHADDRVQIAVDADLSADHRRIAAEQPPPRRVAEHDRLGEPVRLVLWSNHSAELRGDAEQPEVAGAAGDHHNALGALASGQVRVEHPDRRHLVEDVRARRQLVHLRDGEPDVRQRQAGKVGIDCDEAIGRLVRQWPQQHRVDDAEHRRVDADAERDRERGHEAVDRRLEEAAQTAAHILDE
jgi:hypothetical protein